MSTDGQEPERNASTERKEKDAWDKAQIISAFLSSVVVAGVGVVIAGVGLRVNASIQEAQIDSSRRNTEAQAAVARQIADGQRQIQESVLTGQLVEHLASKDAVKRRIAIIALQHAVPFDTFTTIVGAVVKSDESADVRIAAIEQIGNRGESGADATKIVVAAAQDSSRPPEEQQAAKNASDKLQDRAIAGLQPEAASLARNLIQLAGENGITLRVVSGFRTIEEQEDLFRRVPRVTNARVSPHNTGLAFDVGIFENGKFLDGSTRRETILYDKVGALGKQLGLVWGGDYQAFVDKPHFQTKNAQDAFLKLTQQVASGTRPQ